MNERWIDDERWNGMVGESVVFLDIGRRGEEKSGGSGVMKEKKDHFYEDSNKLLINKLWHFFSKGVDF